MKNVTSVTQADYFTFTEPYLLLSSHLCCSHHHALVIFFYILYRFCLQVVLKGDSTSQVVQDDQVKGPLRVRETLLDTDSAVTSNQVSYNVFLKSVWLFLTHATLIRRYCSVVAMFKLNFLPCLLVPRKLTCCCFLQAKTLYFFYLHYL